MSYAEMTPEANKKDSGVSPKYLVGAFVILASLSCIIIWLLVVMTVIIR